MKKVVRIFLFGLFLLFGCSDKKFNSEKWKTNFDEQFFMLNDIIENKRLLGKTKKEIIDLLDTIDIKHYNYSDNSWMYIVIKPYSLCTESPVAVLDIDFENNIVKKVAIR